MTTGKIIAGIICVFLFAVGVIVRIVKKDMARNYQLKSKKHAILLDLTSIACYMGVLLIVALVINR